MTPADRQRLAALAGREFLPASRSHANLMRQIDERNRRLAEARRLRRLRTAEQVGAGATILAVLAVTLFLGA